MAERSQSHFAGKRAFAQLQDHLAIPAGNRGVEWEYRLGQLVDELCPRDKREYGKGVIQRLVDELGSDKISANKLLCARKLSQAITPRELKAFLTKATTVGRKLPTFHVIALASIRDPAERIEIGMRCVERGWSIHELRWEIHRVQGKLSHGGAPVAKLETPDGTLFDLIARSRNWLSRFEQVWFGTDDGALESLSKKEAKRLAALLDKTLDVLTKVRSAAEEGRRRIRALRSGPS